MARSQHLISGAAALLAAMLLAACGGGGGAESNTPPAPPVVAAPAPAQLPLAQLPNAPRVTGSSEVDGFNWFNYRRQQMGLAALARNSQIDTAAQGHSNYQKLNDTITHEQIAGKPGFTGAALTDRLNAAGYAFTQSRYAYGEIISATGSMAGFDAAEGLITAIYHRFVIFEPVFKEAGVGAASVSGGYTYFTTNLAANGLGPGVGRGNFLPYPYANQTQVPVIFYSDRELPDPVPDRNEVGYPVSVHADINAVVNVQTFTLKPRGGAVLPVRLLTNATDAKTSTSVAAIIPIAVLTANTTYDAQFVGTVDGVSANRSWSFTTQ
jgi:uncharacterized protein YkwD